MIVKILRRSLSSALPPHVKVTLPALSPTMSEGGLAKWRKQEGDSISPGQVLCEIETDKATIDMEFQEDGILAKCLVPEKTSNLKVGSVIALMVEDAKNVAYFKDATFDQFNPPSSSSSSSVQKQQQQPQAPPAPVAPVLAAPPPPPVPTPAPSATTMNAKDRIVASPYARKLARELKTDLRAVVGSGPSGRIVAADVLSFVPQEEEEKEEEATSWVLNKLHAPHYYLNMDVNFSAVNALRTTNKQFSASKLSIQDFVIKASMLCMKRIPEANACWKQDSIHVYETVDINIATTAKERSVSYPCLTNLLPFQCGLEDIHNGVMEEKEGTFSIIDVGAYGVKSIVPIVRPGQACALGMGCLTEEEDGKLMARISLSCDHRIVDGAVGAMWLQQFKSYIENPLSMLL